MMSLCVLRRVCWCLFGLVLFASAAGQAQQAGTRSGQAEQPALRTSTDAVVEAVIVDLVVRDKRGRPVLDLSKEEVEVFENGVKQEITSFYLLEAGTPRTGETPPAPDQARIAAPRTTSFAGSVNLVTLVFERLSTEGRQLARQAAMDFLKTELSANVWVAVFTIDQRLYVLQQFTNDLKALRQAVEEATSGNFTRYIARSDSIRRELEEEGASLGGGAGAAPAPGIASGGPPSGVGGMAQAQLAQMTANILRFSESLQLAQEGRSSIFSLMALVREQRRLAGRKTVVYFSEGLPIPPNVVDTFRSLISDSNRANVSVYAVDARGLTTAGQMGAARDTLIRASNASRTQQSRLGGAVTREEVMIGESAEASLRDIQGTLRELSESTGGLLIANTNDLRGGMEHVAEDIRYYYELTYVPKDLEYDGKFRQISVKVSRSDVELQSRSGYFALPPSDGPPVLPHEIPLLAALSSTPPPADFEHRARALRFGHGSEGALYTLIMEVPLANFSFAEDKAANLYRTRFSLMVMVKNAQGLVVQKLSQDYPLEGPLDKLESLKQGSVIFLRRFNLMPGRHTLETAAYDHETNRSSARRAVLVVTPPSQGVAMSDLVVIRRVDPLPLQEVDKENPLHFENMKIIPALEESIAGGPQAQLGLYVVVYPPQSGEKPQLILQFLHNGQLVGQGTFELSKPDKEGRIPHVANLPLASFQSGPYEIRAIVQQGQSVAVEHAFVNIVPTP